MSDPYAQVDDRRFEKRDLPALMAESDHVVCLAVANEETKELARLENVIATPHIGGLTPPASESQAFDTVRQVEALVKGRSRRARRTSRIGRDESDHDPCTP